MTSFILTLKPWKEFEVAWQFSFFLIDRAYFVMEIQPMPNFGSVPFLCTQLYIVALVLHAGNTHTPRFFGGSLLRSEGNYCWSNSSVANRNPRATQTFQISWGSNLDWPRKNFPKNIPKKWNFWASWSWSNSVVIWTSWIIESIFRIFCR